MADRQRDRQTDRQTDRHDRQPTGVPTLEQQTTKKSLKQKTEQ